MLRLVHAQTVTGHIYVDDIDDGLPNKEVHRLGSHGDAKTYKRDGYANSPKQSCYVPRVKAGETSIPGYIDLRETERVLLSSGKGKIYKLSQVGLIKVVSFLNTDIATPAITNSAISGDLTLTGTGFLSVSPDITTVIFSGSGVGNVTVTSAQILAGVNGAISNVSIVVPAALISGITSGDKATVRADGLLSNVRTL